MTAPNAFLTIQSGVWRNGDFQEEMQTTLKAWFAMQDGPRFVLRYPEPAESGLNQAETSIRIRGGLAVMERGGRASCRFLFAAGRRETVCYQLPEGELFFYLLTERMAYRLDRSGGQAEITYRLGQDEQLSDSDRRRLLLTIHVPEDSFS